MSQLKLSSIHIWFHELYILFEAIQIRHQAGVMMGEPLQSNSKLTVPSSNNIFASNHTEIAARGRHWMPLSCVLLYSRVGGRSEVSGELREVK